MQDLLTQDVSNPLIDTLANCTEKDREAMQGDPDTTSSSLPPSEFLSLSPVCTGVVGVLTELAFISGEPISQIARDILFRTIKGDLFQLSLLQLVTMVHVCMLSI